MSSLEKLLQLEAQYGVLQGFTPALDLVLTYLDKVSKLTLLVAMDVEVLLSESCVDHVVGRS